MSSNMCFTKTAARGLRIGALPWRRRGGKTAVTVAVTALVLIITVGAPQAYAGEKIFPGEMCIKWTGAGIPKYYFGNIGNESTTDWLYLDCPMVTDPGYDGGFSQAGVKFRDLHYSVDVSCTLYIVANEGTDGAYFVKSHGTISSTGSKYESQGGFFGNKAGVVKYYPWSYFSCAIPPAYAGSYRSYLLFYWLSE